MQSLLQIKQPSIYYRSDLDETPQRESTIFSNSPIVMRISSSTSRDEFISWCADDLSYHFDILEDQRGYHALGKAALEGNCNIINHICMIALDLVNLEDVNGMTALHYATQCQNPISSYDATSLLIKKGAEINHYRKEVSYSLEIGNGMKFDIYKRQTFTPLYLASENGNLSVIQLLILNGGAINCEQFSMEGEQNVNAAMNELFDRVKIFYSSIVNPKCICLLPNELINRISVIWTVLAGPISKEQKLDSMRS